MPEFSVSTNRAIAKIMFEQAGLAWDSSNGRSAIEILDQICAPFRGTAPDWKAPPSSKLTLYTDPHPENGLGTLLVAAFAPDGLADLPFYRKEAPQIWALPSVHWDEVVRPFLGRYGFRVVGIQLPAFPVAATLRRGS